MQAREERIEMLTAIKLLHTLFGRFWRRVFVALPIAGMLRRFRWAAILTGLIFSEVWCAGGE
jgi:hypothetical protein